MVPHVKYMQSMTEHWSCHCMQELQEQKNELLEKVQSLKTDLQDWRTKLETQVKSYKTVSSITSPWVFAAATFYTVQPCFLHNRPARACPTPVAGASEVVPHLRHIMLSAVPQERQHAPMQSPLAVCLCSNDVLP